MRIPHSPANQLYRKCSAPAGLGSETLPHFSTHIGDEQVTTYGKKFALRVSAH
jgi:hypothetical protein